MVELDKEGYLRNLSDWNDDVAADLANAEGISLTASHWEVIRHLRDFYRSHQLAPANRALVNLIKRDFGADKGNSLYLMKLFGGRPARTACKIAGLPKPDNCL